MKKFWHRLKQGVSQKFGWSDKTHVGATTAKGGDDHDTLRLAGKPIQVVEHEKLVGVQHSYKTQRQAADDERACGHSGCVGAVRQTRQQADSHHVLWEPAIGRPRSHT